MIWKFQPFATDRSKFGAELNAHISLVPNDDDWILVLDYDCMILAPEAYKLIEKAIERYPDTAIFGARTNRCGLRYQRLDMVGPDENDSMRYHLKVAHQVAETHSDGQAEFAPYVGGFFMLFKKSYWNDNYFQDAVIAPNGLIFDRAFCKKAMKNALPIRVIQGVYCWHTYRLEKGEDWMNRDHLL